MDAKQLRLKVLDLAIHGKLVPQDASEEPASVLLSQIKAEKEALVKAGKLKKKDLESTPVASGDIPFEIPTSWEWVQVKEIGEVVTGSTPSKSHKEYYGGNFPFYKPADLDAGFVSLASEYLSDEGKRVSRIIPPFSTAICCIGSIGKVGYIMKEGTTNQQINSVIPCKHVEPKFVYYCCQSSHFVSSLKDRSTTVTISMVNKSNTEIIYIPLPPLSEQKRIVAEVDKWMALIDRMEADMSTLETTAVQLRARLLTLAIQGKLGTQDPKDQPASELLASIAKEKESRVAKKLLRSEKKLVAISADETPFRIPDNWAWIRLGDYVERVTDQVASGSFATLRENVKSLKEPDYAIMVKTADFSNNFTKNLTYTDKHGYEFLSNSNLFGGELILANIGSIGKVFIVPHLNQPMTLAPNSVMVRLISEEHRDYLYYFLLSSVGLQELQAITSGTAMPKFNKTDLKSILIPVPPLAEQKRIVAKIESLLPKLELK